MTEDDTFDPLSDPNHPRLITFESICSAAYRIKNGIVKTQCIKSELLSNMTGMEIWLKKEFTQATGSFKERGVRNNLILLTDDQKSKGVIGASTGNFAQAMCYHGRNLGIPVTVVMPVDAPIMKVNKCKQYGGKVIQYGNYIDESSKFALKTAKETGITFISGTEHINILAGQGTIGLEVLEVVPDLEAIVVPVGGGGMISGISVAVKGLHPNCDVIGVEAERVASLANALKVGGPATLTLEKSIADGLAVGRIGPNVFANVSPNIHKHVTVHENDIAIAILRLMELEKIIVEGAGASGLAACLTGQLDEYKGKKVCLVLSGGNIDTTTLGRIIERGLAADGRLIRINVAVMDRPGGIQELMTLIGRLGASIKDVFHERAWVTSDVFKVEVKLICETVDSDHIDLIKEAVYEIYNDARITSSPPFYK